MLLLALAATALWLVDHLPEGWSRPGSTPLATYGVSAVLALVATGWMVQGGHPGGELVWSTNAGPAGLVP